MGGRQSSQGVSGRHHESPNNQGSSRYSTASLDNASLVARPSGSIDFSSDRPVSRRRRRRDRNDQFIEAHSLPSHLFPFVTGMFCFFLFLLFVFQCHAHVNTYYVCLNLQSSRKMIVANSKIPASPVSVIAFECWPPDPKHWLEAMVRRVNLLNLRVCLNNWSFFYTSFCKSFIVEWCFW